MKKLVAVGMVVSMVGLVSVAAYAAPKGPGFGQGQGRGYYSQMTPEQKAEWDAKRAEIQKARAAFLKDSMELRQKMATKSIEYRTLTMQENFDQKKAQALANEMIDLKSQIAKKRVEHFSKVEGFNQNFGRGFRGKMGRRGQSFGPYCAGDGFYGKGGGRNFGPHHGRFQGNRGFGQGPCFR